MKKKLLSLLLTLCLVMTFVPMAAYRYNGCKQEEKVQQIIE